MVIKNNFMLCDEKDTEKFDYIGFIKENTGYMENNLSKILTENGIIIYHDRQNEIKILIPEKINHDKFEKKKD